jgi:hypothetical protein
MPPVPSLLIRVSEARARGYFTVRRRMAAIRGPMPKLVIGVLPVLPGVFESRHEVVA